MKTYRVLFPVLIAVMLLGATQVFAHDKASSGPIAAVLHVEPHEGLMPGQPAELHVDFSQSEEAFDATTADMAIAIAQGMEPKDFKPLVANGTSTATFPYTLEEGAPYNVMIVGTTSAGTAFHLMYELAPFAEHEEHAGGHDEKEMHGMLAKHGLHAALVVALIVILIVVILQERRKKTSS